MKKRGHPEMRGSPQGKPVTAGGRPLLSQPLRLCGIPARLSRCCASWQHTLGGSKVWLPAQVRLWKNFVWQHTGADRRAITACQAHLQTAQCQCMTAYLVLSRMHLVAQIPETDSWRGCKILYKTFNLQHSSASGFACLHMHVAAAVL